MAKVPKTSGQGTSRSSYQSSYRLGQHGTGAAGSLRSPKVEVSSGRTYTKGEKIPEINVSYGNTFKPTDLKDVKATPPPLRSRRPLKELAPKKWKW